MRPIFAVVAAVGVGMVGALILGEYPFAGWPVLASGLVFGLFVAEAALVVARRGSRPLGIACTAVAAAAMAWSAWISTGRDLSFLGPAGWTSIAVAAAAAGLRTAGFRRGGGSPAQPAPGASPEERPG